MGNCSLMGSSNRTAISSPLFASCPCSALCLMVPNGPPVFELTSYVPAECHLKSRPFGIIHQLSLKNTMKYSKDPPNGRRSYARRSINGAQFFSAMNPRSFRRHFSTAFWYSALTVGYDFPISLDRPIPITCVTISWPPSDRCTPMRGDENDGHPLFPYLVPANP